MKACKEPTAREVPEELFNMLAEDIENLQGTDPHCRVYWEAVFNFHPGKRYKTRPSHIAIHGSRVYPQGRSPMNASPAVYLPAT